MPMIHANGIELCYAQTGDATAPAIVLVNGLGTQMTVWPDEFVNALVARGFRVIRFDNRDCGLSQKFGAPGEIDKTAALQRMLNGQPVDLPYTLSDMAADTAALIDALGPDNAHVVGMSMGGMIAQLVAANHPARCRSLVSIMSTSGAPGLPRPTPRAEAVLTGEAPPAADREACVLASMHVQRVIGSPGYPTSDEDLRRRAERSHDRSYCPDGTTRQFLAVLADGSRVDRLKSIKARTLILHGEDDPLVPVACGQDTARHIRGAAMSIVPGWGHDLPRALAPRIAEEIAAHCQAADAEGQTK